MGGKLGRGQRLFSKGDFEIFEITVKRKRYTILQLRSRITLFLTDKVTGKITPDACLCRSQDLTVEQAWSLNQSTYSVSRSTTGNKSAIDAVAILVRSTRPASKSDLSVVEACPWVVHHHADYPTTQRERSVQKNTGKCSLRLLIALVLREIASYDWSTPCRFHGACSLPRYGCFAEMLRAQAVQKWAEIRQADPFQSEVLGTRRFVNCLRLIRM